MLFADDLFTPRLRLVAITPALLRLGRLELSNALDAHVPEIWPPEHWEPHVLDLIERQLGEAPQTVGWNRFVVARWEAPVVIGTLGGFHRAANEAEIGYSLLVPWQGQGLATEALDEHVRAIFEGDDEIEAIVAHTFPDLIASVRVLQKCGFGADGIGEEIGTVRYRLLRRNPTEVADVSEYTRRLT